MVFLFAGMHTFFVTDDILCILLIYFCLQVRRQKADELQQTVHKEARSCQEEAADLR